MKNRREIKSTLPPNVHLMNKNEAKLLRQLKKKTGLNETEIRQNPDYRKALSEAQDKGERELRLHEKALRVKKQLLKAITKELKLAAEHPKVQKVFKEKITEYKKSGGFLI